MLHSRAWRRFVSLSLVAGFAIFTPVRAQAASGVFESAWQRISELLAGKALVGIFQNAGTEMDPNGKPAPGGAPAVAVGPVASGSHGREPHTVRNSPR